MLSIQQKKQLKAQAHHLKPVVTIGQKGFSDAVYNEIDQALLAHELIKIKFKSNDKIIVEQTHHTIEQKTAAQVIARIGFVSILYRENTKD